MSIPPMPQPKGPKVWHEPRDGKRKPEPDEPWAPVELEMLKQMRGTP